MRYLFSRKQSGNVAKERLRALLITERAECTPETLHRIKEEFADSISRYLDIDRERMSVQITKENAENAGFVPGPVLMAVVPIKGKGNYGFIKI